MKLFTSQGQCYLKFWIRAQEPRSVGTVTCTSVHGPRNGVTDAVWQLALILFEGGGYSWTVFDSRITVLGWVGKVIRLCF